jgi:hypothetical protein
MVPSRDGGLACINFSSGNSSKTAADISGSNTKLVERLLLSHAYTLEPRDNSNSATVKKRFTATVVPRYLEEKKLG